MPQISDSQSSSHFVLRTALACALVAYVAGGCGDDAGSANGPGPQAGAAGNTGGGPMQSAGGSGGSSTGGSASGSAGDGQLGGSMSNGDASTVSSDSAAPVDAPTDVPAGPVAHRVLSSISHQGPLALVAKDGQIEWQFDVLSLADEANDAWLLSNGNVVVAYKKGAREMTPAKVVVWDYPAPAASEIHSCQPIANGHFLVGEPHDGGVAYLRDLDATGKVTKSITVNAGSALGSHAQFREIRQTPQGTYLLTYLALGVAREVDAQGATVHEFSCGPLAGEGPFVAIRLPNNNTLIGCGDKHRVIEVDPQDKIVWEVTETEIAGNKLGFVAGLQRLANGNTVIANWPGHFAVDPHAPQAFELTRDKKLVWELNNPLLKWTTSIEIVDPEAAVNGAVLR
jgi:hypothetical protein